MREINARIRQDRPLTDISRWLGEIGTPITRQALARHAKAHIGVAPTRGVRPVSADFLESVRDAAADGLASGDLAVTLRDGIAAQKALDARIAKEKDRDWQLKLALVLSGHVVLPQLMSPESAVIEGELRPLLLGSGDEA